MSSSISTVEGVDLRFPHHENERAQSRAAGYGFARYWLHNGWVTVGGEKIGKSVGNAAGAASLLEDVRPLDLRYYLGSAHYRSSLELNAAAVNAAGAAMGRIEEFIMRNAPTELPNGIDASALPVAFRNAMDDDLNVPAALAVLHDETRRGNAARTRRSSAALNDAVRSVLAMTSVLSINPCEHPWNGGEPKAQSTWHALDGLVSYTLEQRARARAAGDFATADAIRDTLSSVGVAVHDDSEETTWSLMSRPSAQIGSAADDRRARSGPAPSAQP